MKISCFTSKDFNTVFMAMLTQKDAEFEIYDFNTVFWWLKVILPMQRHYQI